MSHAIDRARERYGLELTTDDLVGISQAILARDPSTYFIRDAPNPRKRPREPQFEYAVFFRGRWICAVVNHSGFITTFVPPDHLKSIRKRLEARRRTHAGLVIESRSH